VTGESAATVGSISNNRAGNPNTETATLSTTGEFTETWAAETGATAYNVYVSADGGTTWTEFSVGNVLTFTDSGQAGTTGSPPSTSTAVSTARYEFDSNIGQGASATVVTGAAVSGDGLNVTATSGLINSDGTLVSGSPYLGTRGYQLQ